MARPFAKAAPFLNFLSFLNSPNFQCPEGALGGPAR